MTEKLLTAAAAKDVFSERNPEAHAFFKGGAPKYISNAEVLEANPLSSFLANAIEANGGKLNSGDFDHVPNGYDIMKAADKEMLASPRMSSGETLEVDSTAAHKYIQSLDAELPSRTNSNVR